jgi:hypothetical protein
MSSAAEKLEAIKKLFFNTEVAPVAAAPVAPEAFMLKDYTLADGATAVQIDTLAPGGQVLVAGVPAPDGDYELLDGHKMKVSGGLIETIEMKQDDMGVSPEMMSKEEGLALSAKVDSLMGKYNAQVKANTAIVEMLSDVLKFEVQAPVVKVSKEWAQMTSLEKHRANK